MSRRLDGSSQGAEGPAPSAPERRPSNAECVRDFFRVVAPGFVMDGELPSAQLEGVEVRHDGRAIAMVQADGRTLPIRFTFDEGKIARVEVL